MTDRISYTVAEAAEAVGMSVDVVRRAYRSGALEVHYPTSRPVILRADLEAWIANSSTEKATA